MTTRTFQVLLALAEAPLHGYGIRQRVSERTEGDVELGSGTLYEIIHRLTGEGWIDEVPTPDDDTGSGGPPRRFYALTEAGRTALRAELTRMDRDLRYAKELRLLPGN